MNKKVLTLCAGFLLAGGMLSSLSAEKLSAVADNGKYYKIVRGATYSSNTIGWENEDPREWFLDLNDANVPGLAKETNDYWKVETVSEENGTYKLVNFSGEELAVKTGENVFSFNKDVEKDHGLTQLLFGTNSWVGNEITDPDNDGFFNLAYQEASGTFTNVHGLAFDAVEESATSADIDLEMYPYELGTGESLLRAIQFVYDGNNRTNIYQVAQDGTTKAYSFKDNKTNKFVVAEKDGNSIKWFTVEKDPLHGNYLKDPTSSLYVKLTIEDGNITAASLVETKEEATSLGFVTIDDTNIAAENLNVLEKDGFSVTIYYDEEDNCLSDEDHLASDIAGNPFKGHLTTMAWTGKEFVQVDKNEYSDYAFYLKNSDGDYIVAQRYEGQGRYEYQALYGFTTVKEADLKHYLIRKTDGSWKEGEDEFFGEFRAFVDGVDFDADPNAITKVDQLTSLYVNIADPTSEYLQLATVGRYDFTTAKVPTLVASQGTSLYPILISLGDREIVDWTTFVQGKFFTIEKVTKDAKDKMQKIMVS